MNHKTYNFLVFPARNVLTDAILSKRERERERPCDYK